MIRETWKRLTSASSPPPAAPAVPSGVRVYAIGDIHGQIDALDRLHDLIVRDAAAEAGSARRFLIIYLGDYVDRGEATPAVLDRLCGPSLPGFERHCLRGNHESAMLDFLEAPTANLGWLEFGGLATLAGYGVRMPGVSGLAARAEGLAKGLDACLPAAHRAFLGGLASQISIGDYLFVHAGVMPGRPLDRQSEDDLLWIREPFLSSPLWHGKRVVHGHTISEAPVVLPNRIGIDTGAFAGGPLTCVVLEDETLRFIATDEYHYRAR
ncbi:metallophosphoesterase family protein [Rhodospirillum rubrum]|uniref:Metallophosphoesterase n=1 Tax=Rhodospirillum rubrum (strain ATCC 11170 / ATH 1.1.1 / DSM 467 / LMG 4362 / NCIMB 8255 / S1) TaxID=269796 RepID=Q2RUA6_RHORT|nr:metallophosphoesterase family protein [Rhodospirillum rubrum]ABC22289.1 Metallophosphoesterase [Rhodospirillum rubrum ATCC 11170]MBK5953857.1 serine/threonine protein phosphatase [Rhodospirillum rubrum]QXG81930.1 serine/threonine protein phosphatase [Rhodospirillum rubrum]HAP98814.1 serine/threonine protein phosphatase [Rhodospirillum rubrum]HCF17233.1 serine/threonine protein phosphatase [Rhodospirillum rubrum]